MNYKENRKLIVILIASFVVIASFTGIVGFISIDVTRDSINHLVGKQSVAIANSALGRIDLSVSNKILELQELGDDLVIQNFLLQSNTDPNRTVNEFISSKLYEKELFYQNQFDFPVFGRIILTDTYGNKIADTKSLEPENFSNISWWERAKMTQIHVQDIYFDELLELTGIEIIIRIDDKRGNFLGILSAFYNLGDIIRIIDESKLESQLQTLEFDLFDNSGFLVYSTSDNTDNRSISNFLPIPLEIQREIEDKIAEVERQYAAIYEEYGIVYPVLTESEMIEIEKRLRPLDRESNAIYDALHLNNLSFEERQELEERLKDLDGQYDTVLQEYGIVAPYLTEKQEKELKSRLMEVEKESEIIYDDFDFDFTFDNRGFTILGTDDGKDVLHSYSRQIGYQGFSGLGWIMMIHTDMDEILFAVNSQRDTLLVVILSVTIVATLLGVYFARIFYRQFQKLHDTEQMSTIGHLSSNIAHDMRNPLGAIRSSVERISDQNRDENKHVTQEINRIKRAVNRMSHQVEGVLNYVRTTPLISDNYSIKEMLTYAKNSIEIPSNIRLEMPENDVTIECDQEKLEITFVNMILNSVQAIGDRAGTVSIRITEKFQNVIIDFGNSGPPIAKEHLPKIFEPLFTTKQKGTGLGLSSCKNIIEQHNGRILVTPDPVVFTITLPKKQSGSI